MDESARHALFMLANSSDFYSYSNSSSDLMPSFFDVRFSIGSPTASCEAVAFRM